MMKPGLGSIALIKEFEGLKLKAYLCPADKWTIGYGTTIYPNGNKVKEGDVCTIEQADIYLMTDLERRAAAIEALKVNQNQFDAILSFVYNLGMRAWTSSTLRKKIIQDAKDPGIAAEFAKWTKAKGVVLNGLVRRRLAESRLYFS